MYAFIIYLFLVLMVLGVGYFLFTFSEWFYDVYISDEDRDDGLS